MDYIVLYGIIGALIGVGAGYFIARITQHYRYLTQKNQLIYFKQELQIARNELITEKQNYRQAELALHKLKCEQCDLFNRLNIAEEQLRFYVDLQQKYKQLNQELISQQEINNTQKAALREFTIRLNENRLAPEEKQHLLINNEQNLLTKFENIVNHLSESNERKLEEQNEQNLNQLIIPLREQLESFRCQIRDSFNQESRERHTLLHEIQKLQQLNAHIAQEAVNLTSALKGNNKMQGNWGEVILSKVLESSGLREGHEFETQISIAKLDERRRQKPDVIVRLPHGKDVIIDAKISLIAYERYFNSNDDAERKLALTEHINSLRNHIKLLSRKDYQQLPGLRSLDYVLMFIPIEPAFIAAISQQPGLISEALINNIMLVSPTTLLVALRTINNLWRYEHQNSNAQNIAERAARLYDKLRLFIDDINAIGQGLDKVQLSYKLAKNKLFDGRGNIIKQAERFRTLGVEIKRPISTQTEDFDTVFANPSKEQEQSNNTSR